MNATKYTSQDYKAAALANLKFAAIRRMQGNERAAKAHRGLAHDYIRQELTRNVNK